MKAEAPNSRPSVTDALKEIRHIKCQLPSDVLWKEDLLKLLNFPLLPALREVEDRIKAEIHARMQAAKLAKCSDE